MRLSEQIGDIAQRILGPPNKALSTRHQFRFGTNGSVAVDISGPKTGTYFNHETHKGGGWRELLLFEGGIAQEDVEEWLEREGFGARAHRRASSLNAKVIATYDYHDENGVLLFQVCRLHPKTFLQRRPDGSGGWTWKVKGVRQIPYRLPELIVAAAK